MINQQLLNPKSIVVIGGSNNEQKPGGAIVRNLKQVTFMSSIPRRTWYKASRPITT